MTRYHLPLTALLLTLVLAACGQKSPTASVTPSAKTGSAAQLGIPKKEEIAALEKAASAGDKNAQFQLGVIYHDGTGVEKDMAKALEWLEKAAAQGEVRAQFNAGLMRYRGEGAKQNLTKALQWFEKAAQAGNGRAAFSIGLMYYRGEGVEPDFTKAAAAFNKAALTGIPDAQFNLGVMAVKGEGIKQDLVTALAWFLLAQESGDTKVGTAIATIEPQMTPEQISDAKKLSIALRKQIKPSAY